MEDCKVEILKVLVGSQAHGLADENSDYDYRSVYVLPTSKILSLNYKYTGNDWIEGDTDNVSYEIGHFLQLALKCNPSILEVFKAPIITYTEEGLILRKLFPFVWNSHDAFNAFVGYGLNQRKKFLERKEGRPRKYAVAYLRTLINLFDLLHDGDFSVDITKHYEEAEILKRWKAGSYTTGEVIEKTEFMTNLCQGLMDNSQIEKHQNNKERVNDFLLTIRRRYW